MKKFLSLIVAVVLLVSCFAFVSCNGIDLAGTYEMTGISGTITYNGQTVELEEDLYDYYRIVLNKDGSCKIESKGADSTAKIEQEGTWEYEDEVLKVKTVTSGVTVVEEMKWDDGVITYDAKQSASGMTINMQLTFQRQE